MRLPLCFGLVGACALMLPASSSALEPKTPWSFKPLARPPVPRVQQAAWVKDGVDVYVLAGLEAKGLQPNGPADRATLLRRATFDLTGLPPTEFELDGFVRDPQEDSAAFTKVLDRLLTSPRFGERWGRHWLDVVRYADSVGRTMNASFPYAFRYRDWVIDALNSDLPFDRFVQAQIAGDLLPARSAGEKQSNLLATGFLTLGSLDLTDRGEQFLMDRLDDQIDVTTRAFLGLTVACARCHDHKTDPIQQTDYYALAGIFLSTRTWSGQVGLGGLGPNGYVDEDELLRLPSSEPGSTTVGRSGGSAGSTASAAPDMMSDSVRKGYPTRFVFRPERAMGVSEDQPSNCAVRVKGDPYETGKTPARGSLELPGLAKLPTIPPQASGRLQLAQWMVQGGRALTARVAVNRLWQHLFGSGLVRTVDDFGFTGEAPNNLALLDHLAARFVSDGWSVKRLLRAIMLSSTYRLSSGDQPAAREVDPGNLLLWRMNAKRLEVEPLRDSLLALGGELSLTRPEGIQVAGFGGKGREAWTRSLLPDTGPCRTVYLPVLRSKVGALQTLFDFPDPSQIKGQRDATTVAAQALFFMNHPFVEDTAAKLARRLQAEKDEARRVQQAYRLIYSRRAEEGEVKDARLYVEEAGGGEEAWTRLLQAMFSAAEFRYVY